MSEPRDDLAGFEEAARAELSARLEREPVRDFLDVVGRVRDLALEDSDENLLDVPRDHVT